MFGEEPESVQLQNWLITSSAKLQAAVGKPQMQLQLKYRTRGPVAPKSYDWDTLTAFSWTWLLNLSFLLCIGISYVWIWRLNNARGFLCSLQPIWVQDCLATRIDQIIVKGLMHVVYKTTLHLKLKARHNWMAKPFLVRHEETTHRCDGFDGFLRALCNHGNRSIGLSHGSEDDCICLMHFDARLNSCFHSLFGSCGTCI